MWHVCFRRKVTLSNFKNKLYVGIREFYEKDGKELPGFKGISLQADQWHQLVQGMGSINATLSKGK